MDFLKSFSEEVSNATIGTYRRDRVVQVGGGKVPKMEG